MKKKAVRYQCFCGCVVESEKMVNVKQDGHKNKRCPEHADTKKGNIEFKVLVCPECGEDYSVGKKSNNSKMCQKCADKKGTVKKFSRDLLYVTECGCRLSSDEIYRKAVKLESGKISKRYACREHHQFIVGRIARCVTCGDYFDAGMEGAVSERCPTHRKRQHRLKAEKRKAGELQEIAVSKISDKADLSRWDCAHWDECLDEAIKKNLSSRPCKNCSNYVQMSMAAA